MEHLPHRRDLLDAAALFHCVICGGEIYAGAPYYQTEDGAVCPDCLRWYAEQAFLPLLRNAERLPPAGWSE